VLNEYGAITKVAKLWNCSHTHVRRWIKKYYPDIILLNN
jgi:hypothetical protein